MSIRVADGLGARLVLFVVPTLDLAVQAALAWRRDRGWPRQAVRSLEDVVRRRRAELGPCHPDTLSARHQLAFFAGEAGETHAAKAAFRELVVDTTATLGPTHWPPAISRPTSPGRQATLGRPSGSSESSLRTDYDWKNWTALKSSPSDAASSGFAVFTRI